MSKTTDQDLATYVVGIGASAGGLEALEKFFRNTPSNTGLAFVIVQHLSPDFKSLMDELLTRYTDMPVHRVEDAMPIEANAVYIIPPRKNLTVDGHKLVLVDQKLERGLNLPIDLFFHSLAREFGALSVAVVLSGTGSDGSRGIEAVKAAGGMVSVQTVEDSAFDGMPRNAQATGIVDVLDTASAIPQRILDYVRAPREFRGDDLEPDFSAQGELAEIMRLFRTRYGIDFTYYRAPTITRRLERRVTMAGKSGLEDYIQYLHEEDREVDALYRDLLVEVTRFFRDPEAWNRLRDDVLPGLLQRTADHGTIRVWVPACATGEEAYSHAMLLAELARTSEKPFDFRVFATDVHPASLELSSAGVYSDEAVAAVPPDLRERYFRFSGGLHHIVKELRQHVILAPHDITRDPPFTKIDLISCRNVLIYLEPVVQRKVLALFHFGLKVDGILFLGPSESVGDLSREFDAIDPHWRVFRKLRDVRLTERDEFHPPAITRAITWRPSYVATMARPDSGMIVPDVFESLLSRYVPPSLLVNEQHELVHSFGEARKLLVQPEGRPSMDVLRLVQGDLQTALSAALHRARARNEQVVFKSVKAEFDGMERTLRMIVEPYEKGAEKLFLVCLEDTAPAKPLDPDAVHDFDSADENVTRVATLERELMYTKESLQATVEELETSNEELQATNEELVAANEELQSTNEELHSVNEELHTVNSEYQRKIGELTEVSNDMDNLLRSMEIGTIFLDRDLCIRKYTPAITNAFQVMPQDVGRPINHIAFRFEDTLLLEALENVLKEERGFERMVIGPEKTPYLECVRPYRNQHDEIDGVVLSFVDISTATAGRADEKLDRRSQSTQ